MIQGTLIIDLKLYAMPPTMSRFQAILRTGLSFKHWLG